MTAVPDFFGDSPNGKPPPLPPHKSIAKPSAPAPAPEKPAESVAMLPTLTLPYLEFSHALMRAVDVRSMTAANRKLNDAMREVLRRQQDLAWELAETTLNSVGLSSGKERTAQPGEVFDRAAAAVRELGEALIEAQLGALRTLQTESQNESPEKLDSTGDGANRSA